MNSDQHNDRLRLRLTELVEYNRDMLQQAQAGNWDKVIEADVLRKEMLESLYTSAGIQKLPEITEATRELLSINKELEALAASARDVATKGAVSIRKGRKAVSAYTRNSR